MHSLLIIVWFFKNSVCSKYLEVFTLIIFYILIIVIAIIKINTIYLIRIVILQKLFI